MILEANGVPYTFFTVATVTSRLDALCRTFQFSTSRTSGASLPFRGGETVRVLDGEDVLLTGHVETVNADYDSGSHSISVGGRDKTGDLLDSTLAASGDFNGTLSLRRACQLVVAQLRLDIAVVGTVRPAPFKAPADQVAPEPGQNAFEFLETLARKRQVLLTSNGEGNILIARASTVRAPGRLQNIIGADDNNVLSASVSYDLTGRYRDYKFISSLNPLALAKAGVTDIDKIASAKGQAIDSAIRVGRQLAMLPESSLPNNNNQERAAWEANVRKARSRVYSVVVQGVRPAPDLPPWEVNTVVDVVDDFAGIDGAMLINSVTYNLDESGGTTTTLALVPTNAYTLELNEPKTEGVGLGFLVD